MADGLPLREELFRKFIHIIVSLLPLMFYSSAQGEQIVWISVFLSIGFLTADLLRLNFAIADKYFKRIFGVLLRKKESERKLTGATWLLLGITAALLLFKKEAAVCAGLIATLADPLAAIIGKWKGSIRLFEKSLQGSMAFLVMSMLIIGWIFGVTWWGMLSALVLTVVEALPVKWNDNLVLPIAAGIVLTVGP